jgi:hypothetical protein
VCTERFRYVRNWLPHLPGTPPADAVRSPTYRVQQGLWASFGELPENDLAERNAYPKAALAVFQQPVPEEGFYDVLVDPHCLNNLTGQEWVQAELAKHRKLLTDWQQETGDSFPGEDQLTPDGFDRETGERLK